MQNGIIIPKSPDFIRIRQADCAGGK